MRARAWNRDHRPLSCLVLHPEPVLDVMRARKRLNHSTCLNSEDRLMCLRVRELKELQCIRAFLHVTFAAARCLPCIEVEPRWLLVFSHP